MEENDDPDQNVFDGLNDATTNDIMNDLMANNNTNNNVNSPTMSANLSPVRSEKSNHMNESPSYPNKEDEENDNEDEFMNDDDGGFRYVTVDKNELIEKGKLIAEMHNFPSYIIDPSDRSSRIKTKYTYVPKKHILKDFLQYFCETRPNVEITEEILSEYDLLPKRPKTSLLPLNVKIPSQPDDYYPIEVSNTV